MSVCLLNIYATIPLFAYSSVWAWSFAFAVIVTVLFVAFVLALIFVTIGNNLSILSTWCVATLDFSPSLFSTNAYIVWFFVTSKVYGFVGIDSKFTPSVPYFIVVPSCASGANIVTFTFSFVIVSGFCLINGSVKFSVLTVTISDSISFPALSFAIVFTSYNVSFVLFINVFTFSLFCTISHSSSPCFLIAYLIVSSSIPLNASVWLNVTVTVFVVATAVGAFNVGFSLSILSTTIVFVVVFPALSVTLIFIVWFLSTV